MEKDTTKQMKRIQIILLLTVILLIFFGGCGDENEWGLRLSEDEMTHMSENSPRKG